mmetsp:Transcript_25033/g.61710  ORF Transcript_25033/g.61710 Transcript_25033/m.61710 type:complete len:212 (-) Transcript_25033:435-1070(-)
MGYQSNNQLLFESIIIRMETRASAVHTNIHKHGVSLGRFAFLLPGRRHLRRADLLRGYHNLLQPLPLRVVHSLLRRLSVPLHLDLLRLGRVGAGLHHAGVDGGHVVVEDGEGPLDLVDHPRGVVGLFHDLLLLVAEPLLGLARVLLRDWRRRNSRRWHRRYGRRRRRRSHWLSRRHRRCWLSHCRRYWLSRRRRRRRCWLCRCCCCCCWLD